MRIRYFTDTDTLYIEFRDRPVAETRDLDENTVLDVDAEGNICAITVEHASSRAGIPEFSYEEVTDNIGLEPSARRCLRAAAQAARYAD